MGLATGGLGPSTLLATGGLGPSASLLQSIGKALRAAGALFPALSGRGLLSALLGGEVGASPAHGGAGALGQALDSGGGGVVPSATGSGRVKPKVGGEPGV